MKRTLLSLSLLFLFSPFVFSQPVRVGQVALTASVTTSTSSAPFYNQVGSGIGYHRITWSTQGSAFSSCQVKLEKSINGTTWSDLIAAATCTSAGSSAFTSDTANFIRVNATTLAGDGTLTVNYLGYLQLGMNWSGTGSSTQVAFFDSSGSITGDADLTYSASLDRLTLETILSNASNDLELQAGTTRQLFLGSADTRFWTLDSSGHLRPNTANGTLDLCGSTTICRNTYSTNVLATTYSTPAGNAIIKTGTPSCSGAGCAIVTGAIDSAGKVTTTTTGAASIVITFSAAFARAPACTASNETTANLLRCTTTTTTATIAGVTVNADTLSWVALGN